MSTPTVTTKPDVPERRPERPPQETPTHRADERREPPPFTFGAAPTDRTVDADLLIDVPRLVVEELSLELEASLLLNRVRLDAKGLEAGLYLKGNFEHLQALVRQQAAEGQQRSEDDGSEDGRGRRAALQGAAATGLTAAAAAGGAVLKSRLKPSRKLRLPRRRSFPEVVRDEIANRLP